MPTVKTNKKNQSSLTERQMIVPEASVNTGGPYGPELTITFGNNNGVKDFRSQETADGVFNALHASLAGALAKAWQEPPFDDEHIKRTARNEHCGSISLPLSTGLIVDFVKDFAPRLVRSVENLGDMGENGALRRNYQADLTKEVTGALRTGGQAALAAAVDKELSRGAKREV